MDTAVLREDMVEGLEHESRAVLEDAAVAAAMCAVPRHRFLDDHPEAYADREHERLGTCVLAPSTVARLMEALDPTPGDSTLIVGAGVGYTAAVLAELVGERNVHAVEIARPVVAVARENLAETGYGDVLVDWRDGAEGLPAYAPYDKILIEAAAVAVPATPLDQLAPDGRLVFPRGSHDQRLVAVEADGTREPLGPVSFDPLLVDGEQTGSIERNRTAREDVEFAQRRAERRRGWEQEWIEWE